VKPVFCVLCLLLAGHALAQDIQPPALASGQSVLNNESIVKMVKAGLGEEVIVSSIKAQPGRYATGPDDLISLKGEGASDKIITAMVDQMASGGADRVATVSTGEINSARPVQDVGVYYKNGAAWTDLSPEIVNFKTGGVLKHMGTVGIVKGDVNGHVIKKHSTTLLKLPVDLLVYVPEGVDITEYQLLRLHEAGNGREFRTVTGGVFHVSGGATRDWLSFESKKVASRTYEISLADLKPGEYGLLPPSGSDATGRSGRIGKIHSFRIVE
jgi:hypothetical protein